jgi:hypothetical protein
MPAATPTCPIGHKNPNADSIRSTLADVACWQVLAEPGFVAARGRSGPPLRT